MKVCVIGAKGRVGTKLVEKLVEVGHSVYAAARNTDSLKDRDSVTPVEFDLHGEVTQMEELLADAEAVYFVAGSGGKDLLQTDLFGAVKAMQATENKGIKRYIELSSLFALQPEYWNNEITNYNIAKFFSDHWLIDNTKLDYTIVQPGNLTEEDGSGSIEVDVKEGGENSIENVAQVLCDVLDMPNTYGKVIKMHDGDTPINEALEQI